jgi:hypothetical protein
MAEIEFTIDPTTGKLDVRVKGVRGPSCQDVATLVEDLLGKPAVDQNTPEYYLKPQVRPQIQPKRMK